ncbi:CaiF/GrlA family transcriptional regulator [Salmonella enterica subsp. enterica]|nr:CaiF/GrlA family transcriptional regulator [Salmonella enterica subsp. enterica]
MGEWTVHNTDGVREGWSLPPGMSDMEDAPLYLAVAVWGMRLDRLVTSEDICRHFCVTQRRASDVLHYIVHEGSRWVTCERRVVIRDGRGRRLGLRIRDVTWPDPEKIRSRRRKVIPPLRAALNDREKTGKEARIKVLRMWMVKRRPGESVPQELLALSSFVVESR